MPLHPSRFERTTALTDAMLGFAAGFAAVQLSAQSGFKFQIWAWAFGLLAFASLLGALAHGFVMSQQTNARLWIPLNLALGLALGMFVVGAVFDWRGEESARTILPFMLILGFAFLPVAFFFPDSFLPFILYESAAMMFALGVYLFLFFKGTPGAGWMTAGIFVTMLAAAAQASGKAGTSMLGSLDNNGVFHLIQILALALLYAGLRA